MKPRIFWSRGGNWICFTRVNGLGIIGLGATPKLAYLDWQLQVAP